MSINRRFAVHILASKSSKKQLNNGLPQGSVLALLTLFNLCISDLPDTTSQKFEYADDIAIIPQHEKFENNEAHTQSRLRKTQWWAS
ncbi:unnamed protein product [Macrosiphum euphorbiae]|uniref:Reverse transcriptase domain-containing protein n=1 Tax=Macrosiphum euphorbiae TaxID=13131 RepID=A0AAV0W0M2_9HEMI|nr:unnamed protein product [Macrosiphum euphorbiae]